jgi:hypothetical protein
MTPRPASHQGTGVDSRWASEGVSGFRTPASHTPVILPVGVGNPGGFRPQSRLANSALAGRGVLWAVGTAGGCCAVPYKTCNMGVQVWC